MGWVRLLQGLLSLANAIATHVNNKQLMDAGAAKATLVGIRKAEKEVQRARKIRGDFRDAIADDPSKLRAPDKHKRR